MIKYFSFPVRNIGGLHVTMKEETCREINDYANQHNLKVIQISVCGDNGLFVVFDKENSST